MRAGLGLLTDAGGNKAVMVSFSINGENPRGPGHGFVVAYDVRGLNRDAGFTPTPAIWNVTPGGGAGGVWMSGSGPAIDGSDIYFATETGWIRAPAPTASPRASSSCDMRRASPASTTVNRGSRLPTIGARSATLDVRTKIRILAPPVSSSFPERGNLIGGGKDGILYNLDKNNLGKDTWNPQFNLPFVATYLPNPPTSGAGLPTTTVTNPNWPIVNRDRNLPAQTPAGKSYHIHGTPVYLERATGGIVFLWGENERLKGYNFNFATKRITAFRAQGTQIASGNMSAPGGMPGGRLVVSSNGTTPGTAVVWGVYPTEGNANSDFVHGALVAYDATTVLNGNRLKQLFHSDTDPANSMGNFAKYSTPVVANGKVYVGTFSNKVVQYGLAPGLRIAKPAGAEAASPAPAAARTASTTSSLSDLGAMTFGCPAAALNAAAREASKVPSLGSYQFSYFITHSNSHHGSYEVHFKSNYQGEPDLKYCVAIYCQQGWDPATTKTLVTLMGTRTQSAAGAVHGGECSAKPAAGRGRGNR